MIGKGSMNMKRMVAYALALLFMAGTAFSALAEGGSSIERNGLLDTAFTLLEDGNPFLVRYNELTGANVEVVFEQGSPYFFGGKSVSRIFKYLPYYSIRDCWEDSRFFKKGQFYIFGFDCAGYTQWIFSENGLEAHDSLNALLNQADKYGQNHIFSHREGKQPPAYGDLKPYLKVGDLLITKQGSRHVMMYIGTLSDYGYTAEQVPELADYLDYPLVIHSGPHPDAGERFQQVINDNPEKYGRCKTTDGCVNVSIIGVPFEAAPFTDTVQKNEFHWFELENGYKLTIRNYDDATAFAWYRHVL